jgi:hypothetical protein
VSGKRTSLAKAPFDPPRPSSKTGFDDLGSGERRILIPRGIVDLRVCLPIHGGLGFTIAEIGIEPSQSQQDIWTRISVKERNSKREFADSTEDDLYDTHDRRRRRDDLIPNVCPTIHQHIHQQGFYVAASLPKPFDSARHESLRSEGC